MTLKKFSFASSTTVLFYCLLGVYPTNSQIIPDSTTNTSVINNCADSCNISGGKQSGQSVITPADTEVKLSSTVILTDNLSDDPSSRSGDITLQSKNLNLSNSAWISASANYRGKGGEVKIDIREDITIDNAGLLAGVDLGASGDAGNLTINAQNLYMSKNGIISSATAGKGSGGDVNLNIADTIKLDLSLPNRTFPTIITTATVVGEGAGGDIRVNADQLIIRDGAEISSGSGGFTIETGFIPFGGRGGDITVNVEDSIQIEGISPDNIFPSGIVNRTLSNNPAGDIEIDTGKLKVEGQGIISASSLFGEGRAGNLNIVADNIFLSNGANLSATTLSGKGGNIQLNVEDILTLRNLAAIETDASGSGNGGNIDIDGNFTILSENSLISANAEEGQGGNINIFGTDVFLSSDSMISASASAEVGIDGEVEIRTFNTSDRHSLVPLPETTIKTDDEIVAACGVNNYRQGGFSYTGKGGLPGSLLTKYGISDRDLLGDIALSPESTSTISKDLQTREFNLESSEKIMEAASWKVNHRGKVELVAKTKRNLQQDIFANSDCPFLN